MHKLLIRTTLSFQALSRINDNPVSPREEILTLSLAGSSKWNRKL